MDKLPFGALGYCEKHNFYYGSVTDTIPTTQCVMCSLTNELRAQPAPRTYEVARALAHIETFENTAQIKRADAADIARDVASYLERWRGKNFERIVEEMTEVIAKYAYEELRR